MLALLVSDCAHYGGRLGIRGKAWVLGQCVPHVPPLIFKSIGHLIPHQSGGYGTMNMDAAVMA